MEGLDETVSNIYAQIDNLQFEVNEPSGQRIYEEMNRSLREVKDDYGANIKEANEKISSPQKKSNLFP